MTERDELISAYLDGDATAVERARVEADPSMLAEVERFREVSEQVSTGGDLGVADPFTRRRHLGAALAAFDDLQASSAGDADIDLRAGAGPLSGGTAPSSTASAAVPDVVAMARPDRRRRPLGALAAAAAGVVLLVGVAIPLTGGDDDAADLATASMEDAADDAARSFDSDSADDAGDAASMAEESMDVAEEAMEEEAMEEMAVEESDTADEESVDDTEGDQAAETASDDTGEADTGLAPQDESDIPVLVDVDRPELLLEEMVARWENGIEPIAPVCALIEDRVTLHVAPGTSPDGLIDHEIHLLADDEAGTGFEAMVFTLPECSPT